MADLKSTIVNGKLRVTSDANVSGNLEGATISENGTQLESKYVKKTEVGTAASKNTGTSSGNVPVLDSNGKLSTSVIPSLAITDTFTAASESAMTSLSAQKGDVCIRTDLSKTFILTADGASTLANWKELATPTDTVLSVNGKTGAVTLTASDIGAIPSDTTIPSAQIQSDWNQTNTSALDYIKNKPTIPTDTNQKVKVGSTTFGANTEINLVAGDNVTITPDTTNNKITIAATDTNTHNSHKVNSGKKSDGSTDITSASASSGDITLGDSGVTAGSYGNSTNQNPGYGDTFNVPYITVNAKGIVTGVSNKTVKIPASDENNTTYTFATGDANGQIKVTPSNGTAQNVSVKGLGSAAYTESSAYATASHSHSDYLPKTTYEWNKEISFGGSGYLKIGSFPMYDTNVTIDIDSTTSKTYHGTVVIATQNVSESSIGSAHVVKVYDDPSGVITDSLRVVWTSGSRNYDIYFIPQAYSKNFIHIRALGLRSAATDICTSQTGTAPSTTSGLGPVNALLSFDSGQVYFEDGIEVNSSIAMNGCDITDVGGIEGSNYNIDGDGWLYSHSTGLVLSGRDDNRNYGAAITVGTGDDDTDIEFKGFTGSGQNVQNIYTYNFKADGIYLGNTKVSYALGTTSTTAAAGNHDHDSTYIKYTSLSNYNSAGTTKTVAKTNPTAIYVPNGLIMGGTAGAAGLITRGICGCNVPTDSAANKDMLFLNYDGDNTYRSNRQVIIQAGDTGTHYGNNVYQYAAVRGDAFKSYADANYLGISATAADSNKLGNVAASNYIQKSETAGLVKNDGTIDTTAYSTFTGYTSSNKLSTNNISGLATVATSGSYNDLSDKPTIPTVDYPVTDVKIGTTSIVSSKEATIQTNSTYNASTNKIATMSDVTVTDVQINGTSILSSKVANLVTNTAYNASTNKIATMSDLPTASSLGLSSALKFLGTTTSNISDEDTTNPIVINNTNVTATNGNVVIKGNKEFLWNGSSWEELGDESSFALKTVSISTGDGLTGGGSLEADRTLSLANNYGDTKNPYASKTKNYVLAAPSNANGAPSFRALVAADIPDLSSTYLTSHLYRAIKVAGTQKIANSSDAALDFVNTGNVTFAYDSGVKASVSVSSSNNTASWESAVTVGTVGGTDLKFTMPANPNTHYTATPVLGTSSATSNASSDTTNTTTYLNIVENSAKSGGVQIKGSSGVNVNARNGVLTIQLDNNVIRYDSGNDENDNSFEYIYAQNHIQVNEDDSRLFVSTSEYSGDIDTNYGAYGIQLTGSKDINLKFPFTKTNGTYTLATTEDIPSLTAITNAEIDALF